MSSQQARDVTGRAVTPPTSAPVETVESIHSTPAKPKHIPGKRRVISIARDLQEDMAGFQTTKLDIFFQYTFGLRQEAYESQIALVERWCMHNESAGELKTALDKFCLGKQEKDLYDPFVTMCTWFIKKAQDELKEKVQRNITVKRHDVQIIDGINARKPDAVIVTAGMEAERTWSPILCAIELKRIEDNKRLHPDGGDGDDEQPRKRSRGSHPVSGQVSGGGARSGGNGRIASQGVPPVSEGVSDAHGSLQVQDVNTPNTGEQAGAAAVTAAQAQLGGYAMEMLTACEWPFALGMLVQGTRLTLWCFQRSIAVRTIRLDLTRDLAVLGLFLVQILCAQDMFLDAPAIWQKQVQSLECEATISTAGLGENEYWFERSDILDAGEIITQLRSLTGRATQIRKVTAKKSGKDYPNMVLKRSWKRKDSQLEVELIREARTVLSVSENIVKVFAHGIVEDVSAAERFELLGLGTDMLRVPHLSLMEEYLPIWKLKDEKKFWDVVVQLYNCLHALYSERGILHRDISIGNVCFLENGDRAICKLIDFDHATHFGMRTSGAGHRSGTAPFMACEVLDKDLEGYVHRLHHDFESVLYMCVWHVFGFSLEDVPGKSHPIYGWRAGSWKSMLNDKGYFISSSANGTTILNFVSGETHKNNCKELRSVFGYASKQNDELLDAHESKRKGIDMDKRAAWDKAKPYPGKYARYATFPAVMKGLKQEVKACTKDCCVQPTMMY